ncbi:hypothetical protein VPNG_00795 [Cytospora leucostoma]|uniref:Uncharacterized protein n=1 Tax=Cytospora leucostoma TaxID=1230097 RepID=A0A423XM48_9PEZI|nr:hypothetical protein VPNG_00795 [Cytospora leucostoma]
MSGITDKAATQAHDIVQQAEAEEQRVQGSNAITGERNPVAPKGNNKGGTSGQAAKGQIASKLQRIKEALHLNK